METLHQFVSPPHPCGYLPDQTACMEYRLVAEMTAAEYQDYLLAGWRHFGHSLFRPRCRSCSACWSLRVSVDQFRPNRSQRRAQRANQGDVRLEIGQPSVDAARLHLHDRYHQFMSEFKDWPDHGPKDPYTYYSSFVDNPFPVEEWCYYRGKRLVGIGYFDVLPLGLSAIYFFYDPDERGRSPGTYNVLTALGEARRRGLPHVYLGYYVEGSRSMHYKGLFLPNEVLRPPGTWQPYRGLA